MRVDVLLFVDRYAIGSDESDLVVKHVIQRCDVVGQQRVLEGGLCRIKAGRVRGHTWNDTEGLVSGSRTQTGVGASAVEVIGALGLVAVFAIVHAWVFIWLGLVSGSAQAAQGLGIIGVPFSFLSSAFVPTESMPSVLQVFAEHQPLTFMVDAVRGLLVGDAATATFEHSLSYYVVGSLLWSLALVAVFAPLAVRGYRRR